jgi:hypothetical protein
VSDATEQNGLEALGLTQIEAQPLGRVPIRQRESSVTTSAWRLQLRCDQGEGGIVRLEVSGQALYRGDGLFLGWSQEHLGQVYETLTRPTGGGDSELEFMQLG